MPESSDDDARSAAAIQQHSRELEAERARLHEQVIDTAEQVRRTHEQVADTLDRLADHGGEHAPRRRDVATRSRRMAEEETRQIAELDGRRRRSGARGSIGV